MTDPNDDFVRELRRRLEEVEGEFSKLDEEQRELAAKVEQKRLERDALIRIIKGLEPGGPDASVPAGSPLGLGPRDSIKDIAKRMARQNGGLLKVRDLLKATMQAGFKSDQGGLHTYLMGSKEFLKSNPGEFRLIED
jgi:hypothetical protein